MDINFNCPRCGTASKEFLECDICKVVGCVRCITKRAGGWVCEKCRSGEPVRQTYDTYKTRYESDYVEVGGQSEGEQKQDNASADSALASMFG